MLSLCRLVALPFFVLFLLRERPLPALLLFLFMGASDVADGYFARRWGQATRLGQVLDHAVDKVVTIVVSGSLALTRGFPLWAFYFLLAREVSFLLVGSFLATVRGVIARSNNLGRAAGGAFYFTALSYIVGEPEVGLYLLYFALVLYLVASLKYLRTYFPVSQSG